MVIMAAWTASLLKNQIFLLTGNNGQQDSDIVSAVEQAISSALIEVKVCFGNADTVNSAASEAWYYLAVAKGCAARGRPDLYQQWMADYERYMERVKESGALNSTTDFTG